MGLVARCETQCVAACCGINAYDFDPIHVASFLIMYEGKPRPEDLAALASQLRDLRENFGSQAARSESCTIDGLNQIFTPQQIDALVSEIEASIATTLELINLRVAT